LSVGTHDVTSDTCRPVNEILALIGDKWTVLILMALVSGPRRFTELRRAVPGISQRMLTLTLRALERDGFVLRTVTPSIPPRVDYEVTDLGRSLQAPVTALGLWAIDHRERIEAARRAFDAASTAPAPPGNP
jgi:DNA-binding HxlR family transcriptional regulator